jgi:hypothetical protein
VGDFGQGEHFLDRWDHPEPRPQDRDQEHHLAHSLAGNIGCHGSVDPVLGGSKVPQGLVSDESRELAHYRPKRCVVGLDGPEHRQAVRDDRVIDYEHALSSC